MFKLHVINKSIDENLSSWKHHFFMIWKFMNDNSATILHFQKHSFEALFSQNLGITMWRIFGVKNIGYYVMNKGLHGGKDLGVTF